MSRGEVDLALAQRIVNLLNDLCQADRTAMHCLIEERVRANDSVAEHPTVQVAAPDDGGGGCLVGVLGILNGLCGAWNEETAPQSCFVGWGPVAATFDNDGQLTGFKLSHAREPLAHDEAHVTS